MSDKTPFTPFAAFAPFVDFWADAMRGQISRAATVSDEVTKLERAGLEQFDAWTQETARLAKAQTAYAIELGAAMRKMGLEAMTQATAAKA